MTFYFVFLLCHTFFAQEIIRADSLLITADSLSQNSTKNVRAKADTARLKLGAKLKGKKSLWRNKIIGAKKGDIQYIMD